MHLMLHTVLPRNIVSTDGIPEPTPILKAQDNDCANDNRRQEARPQLYC